MAGKTEVPHFSVIGGFGGLGGSSGKKSLEFRIIDKNIPFKKEREREGLV